MKPSYSVAMSQDTGCIVMVRTSGTKVTVMGSLTKDQSDAFARSVLDWAAAGPAPETIDAAKAVKRALYQH